MNALDIFKKGRGEDRNGHKVSAEDVNGTDGKVSKCQKRSYLEVFMPHWGLQSFGLRAA